MRIENDEYTGHNFKTLAGISHKEYNRAVRDEFDKFMVEKGMVKEGTVITEKIRKKAKACLTLVSFPRKGGQGAENLRKKNRYVHHDETETNDARS